MKAFVARDALHANLRRVAADQRPDRTMAGVFAIFETNLPDARLLGVVTPHDVASSPGHIFADVLPRRVPSPIPAELGLEETVAELDASGASALPVVTANGGFLGAVTRESLCSCLLAQDRAFAVELSTLRTRLEVADRLVALGTLAAGVAHEINNPLAFALLSLEALRRVLDEKTGPAESNDASRLIGDIGTGLERVRVIVRDLQLLARPAPPRGASADVGKALAFAVSVCSFEIRHHARLVTDFGTVPAAAGDEGRLSQIFINLLLNAAQAIPDGAADDHEIRLSTRTDEAGWAVVEVRDSGSGMTEEVRAHIFDPFFTTKTNGSGLGLGLAVCHGIVTGLGGRIEVSSEAGVGTCFRVLLPPGTTVPAPIEARAVKLPASPPPIGRVLVVDDEATIVSVVARHLGVGQCTTCHSGREAMERIRAGERFDVILCDLTMPSVSGAEVYAELLRLAPDQASRFVVMTGGARSDSARAFIDSLRHQPLMKPFSREELFESVREILERGPTDASA